MKELMKERIDELALSVYFGRGHQLSSVTHLQHNMRIQKRTLHSQKPTTKHPHIIDSRTGAFSAVAFYETKKNRNCK